MASKRAIDAWLKKAKPEEIEVPVCLNRELLSEFDRLVREHQEGERRRSKFGEAGGMLDDEHPADATAHRLAELLEAIKADEAEHTFRFRKMAYADFREIIEANPPTERQRSQNSWLDHDPDQAAPLLVAGSCVFPELTPEDAENLRESLPESIWAELYGAALRANRSGTVIPKDVRSSVESLAYELRSSTPPATESPSLSSADA